MFCFCFKILLQLKYFKHRDFFCVLDFKDLKMECLQDSQELNMQKLRTSELILNKAKQKMRELTINIRMKEDLIKELIKTGNGVLCLCEKEKYLRLP